MKIFITGGSGLIGQYLNRELAGNHQILTQYNLNPGNCSQFNSIKLDIRDHNKLEEAVSGFKPDIIIHAAAISSPEKADSLPADLVYDINVNSTQSLAEICSRINAGLFYFSTDLVYAGYRGSNLKEDAKLIPVSLYAETKLMGEVKIKETFDNYLILRESLIIGFGLNHSLNNFHRMYQNLKSGKPVKLFTDQFRSPLALKESAAMINRLIEKNIKCEIVNFAGPERVSRYELGEILCEETGIDKNLLIKTTMEEEGILYKVADVSLNTDKLRSFGIEPKNLRQSIREMF
ncbi:MAG TPA: SDR family oxidoreductase [Melioribacteraceae bacterium]|nr:SDR family oxidoreductase [Melioribacteraceae bacterium]